MSKDQLQWYGQSAPDSFQDKGVLNADFASLVGMTSGPGSSKSVTPRGGANPENVIAAPIANPSSLEPCKKASQNVPRKEKAVLSPSASSYDVPKRDSVPPSSSSDARPSSSAKPTRQITCTETIQSVERALSAKEHLVSDALLVKRKRAVEETRRLTALDQKIKQIDQEEQRKIDLLRQEVEIHNRSLSKASEETKKKKEIMEKATKEYIESEERRSMLLGKKKEVEDQLVELILESGKRKDEELNKLLAEIGE